MFRGGLCIFITNGILKKTKYWRGVTYQVGEMTHWSKLWLALYLRMFLSVCSIRYTVLFNKSLIRFAGIIILIVFGNKLTLAVLFDPADSSPAGGVPGASALPATGNPLAGICAFVFDILKELAWILPLALCLISCKDTKISDAGDLCISVRKSCAGSSSVPLLPLGLGVQLIEDSQDEMGNQD